jgi:hypothetical protein
MLVGMTSQADNQLHMEVHLQIPDDLAKALQGNSGDLSQAALEAIALDGYRTRRLSESQVRRLLGLQTRLQVHALLKAHNIYLNYSEEDLVSDLATLETLQPVGASHQ